MNNKLKYQDDLKTIKKIMEESSRFISLSGLSGIFAGLSALAGVVVASIMFFNRRLILPGDSLSVISPEQLRSLQLNLIIESLVVLLLAIGGSLYFSYRRSRKQGLRIWTPVSKRMLANFLVPLVTGGIFIVILNIGSLWQLIVPSMLIFYGLSLVSAGKFTYSEVFYLGIIEIVTGLLSALLPSYALLLWGFGFGFLHIAYGIFMYRKYEG